MLKVENLVKSFGDYKAVNDISFEIPKGKILGLIGQNGAGKTTTFRLILDFLKADKGLILWDNQPVTKEIYNLIGYMPEERGLYPKETVENQLIYFASLRGMKRKDASDRIDRWMENFQVKGKRTDKLKKLSKGNQQKVQLIATLLHEPKLVILDEPFSGLDPVNAGILKDAIINLKSQGASVIFSSHNMDNVEQISDHLVMLKSGKMVLNGEIHQIRESFGRTKLLLEAPISKAALLAIDGVLEVKENESQLYEIKLRDESIGHEIFKLVNVNNYIPVFSQQPPTLEEIFKMKAGAPNE
ncbi:MULTISPECIES: ABC transporter ATP-binding protein [unclassified Enterococcus]|uniref:ABC transporter ATP-binding protein n=1 Tax=unclassified Enterococcus TaxID=2608891 RepID=UPI001557C1B6|nr:MULTISPECIES: ABC transporter ATP-binding protein [unclassified Enterococcus]MBS7577768.1 ABC transporter ATP-binding protein [Enterococcus sp. MMGLQ5-2]MBS7585028.1 ABC transporter ATP-binding protein [Enterococcus sp. MMGLQ5-1]NPD12884.1 ABC transporter ATP-binding protein [Enterococcus sp. MMGLQ5-1]NPD37598.1 ABC transporter ATP-binding protein [Enterococcus sp. MMGLQ5-2]